MQLSPVTRFIDPDYTQELYENRKYILAYLGNFLLDSLPVLFLFQPDLPRSPEALDGASSAVNTDEILLLLSSLFLTLLSLPLLFPFFSQSPQLPAVLLFENGYFLDILVVESFPQCLQLCRQACRPGR